MNQLAHFFLAHPQTGLMAGGFMGDHIKGRLKGQFSEELEAGIRLHRSIDAFTDQHIVVKQSLNRFQPPFRRYAGIICDVVFDYFLACHWRDYATEPLDQFAKSAYASVLQHRHEVPAKLVKQIERMQKKKILEQYVDRDFIRQVLIHLGTRLKHSNPMAESFVVMEEIEPMLLSDFKQFMPLVISFSKTHG